MAEVRWTLQAADDLEGIVEFIATESRQYAVLLALDIFEAVERLATFPKTGRIVPETDDPVIREVLLGNYRIIYRVAGDFVHVLTISHGARILDPKRLTETGPG